MIDPATLTVQPNPVIVRVGDPLPPFTATTTGFRFGDTPSVFTNPLMFSTPVTDTNTPGVFPISVFGATADNYVFNFVDGGGLNVRPAAGALQGVTEVGAIEEIRIPFDAAFGDIPIEFRDKGLMKECLERKDATCLLIPSAAFENEDNNAQGPLPLLRAFR